MTYDYCWHVAPLGTFATSGDLAGWGKDGWRVVTVISRPGLPERVLLEREGVAKPKGKSK